MDVQQIEKYQIIDDEILKKEFKMLQFNHLCMNLFTKLDNYKLKSYNIYKEYYIINNIKDNQEEFIKYFTDEKITEIKNLLYIFRMMK